MKKSILALSIVVSFGAAAHSHNTSERFTHGDHDHSFIKTALHQGALF
ncbi:hypothetical protein P7F88_08680 [Vibrio hannami]|nr:hypothetical protein [Vibrio hannami]MDG3086172.1 hypothetical protein [Vibrio hannami]